MKDTIKLGHKITTEQNRDAVHVAIAPVLVGETLQPGQRVNLRAGVALAGEPSIGVIDPFLSNPAVRGDRVWLFLYPGTVQNLRHMWDHEDFPEPEKEEEYEYDGCRGC